jgi:hypothetical protein
MDRVLRYDVVEASSIDRLVAEVQLRISCGWQPLSGPFYLKGSHFQAMVWTESSERGAVPPATRYQYRQSEIELIDELTEDDQPLSRWEVGVDNGRSPTQD